MIPISFSKPILEKLRKQLQVAYEMDNIKLYRTIQALSWSGEGQPVSKIAPFLQVTTQTIYNGIKSFICKSFSFRERYVGRGRKSKLTQVQKSELYKMIESGPAACGLECGVWNTALIAERILLKFGVKYNPRYLSRLLKKMGLTKKHDLYRISRP